MLTDLQVLVDAMVRDAGGVIDPTDRDRAIASAVLRYSSDRPRTQVTDQAAAGGHFLDLPEGWDESFSRVVAIETPVGQVPPAVLPAGSWTMYQLPAGWKVMLEQPLAAAVQVRMTVTRTHQVDDLVDTVPSADHEAVANWAAAMLLDQLANAFAGDRQATIQADSVDHQAKSRDYGARAKAHRQAYLDHIGVDTRRNVAAGAVVTIERTGTSGRRPLVHGRRP